VLKPGGKLIIGDIHLDSLVWFSDDKDRMNRMITSWDHHFMHRDVPAILPSIMRDAGFVVEDVTPMTTCDHTLKPDGLATMMMQLLARYAGDNNLVPADEAAAWLAEQKAALMPLWLSWGQDLAHVRDVHLHTGIDHDEDADKADRLI